jgi:deoxycytidylate deaminase
VTKIYIVKEDFWPGDYKLNDTETRKWLRLTKAVQEVESPCYSKQIGVVIVDPNTNSMVSCGHNGPPQGCPPNDSHGYLKDVVWPQLTAAEVSQAMEKYHFKPDYAVPPEQVFAENFRDCKQCPRRIVGAERGKRLELCTCIHGETDAIARANRNVSGCYMMCYCGVPCVECTKVIINAGIDTVVALDNRAKDYSVYSSRWLFEKSNVQLVLVPEDWIWIN